MNVAVLEKDKRIALKRRHARIHKRISGAPECPRPVVIRPNRHMVAQVVDDTKNITLVSVSALRANFAGFEGTKTEAAKKVGELIAEKAKAAGITTIVFNRDGNKYTGRIVAVADSACEGGLTL